MNKYPPALCALFLTAAVSSAVTLGIVVLANADPQRGAAIVTPAAIITAIAWLAYGLYADSHGRNDSPLAILLVFAWLAVGLSWMPVNV